MTLGERIRAARREAGLSQEALAERMGVSRQAVAKWEADKSAPSTNHLLHLADCLGIPREALLSPEKEPVKEPDPAAVAAELNRLQQADTAAKKAAKREHIRRNCKTALLLAAGWLLFYLIGRCIWCSGPEHSVMGWLYQSRPEGAHSYLFGWILHGKLFWIAAGLSILFALSGWRIAGLVLWSYQLAGFLIGMGLGPNEAGIPYGQSHFGWAYWLVTCLFALPMGFLLERSRRDASLEKSWQYWAAGAVGVIAAAVLVWFLIPRYGA